MGAPGAGKGTQAKRLAESKGWVHISTGDILRKAIQVHSPLGRKVKTFVETGDLVPDDIMIQLVEQRLTAPDCREGFILDGFPRTVVQAEALDRVLAKRSLDLDAVLSIEVDDEVIVRRLSMRFVCASCGVMVQGGNGPEYCSHCGGKLVRRKDDEPETVRYRLKVYRERTEALIHYYRGKGLLLEVDGLGDVGEVGEKISAAIAERMERI